MRGAIDGFECCVRDEDGFESWLPEFVRLGTSATPTGLFWTFLGNKSYREANSIQRWTGNHCNISTPEPEIPDTVADYTKPPVD